MKELLNQFLLGSCIKLIDEISDVPSLTEKYKSYLQPFMFITVFLYGLDAGNDFYYNVIWIAWFISAYFGKSMDNEVDKGFWELCFFLVLFALVYSVTYPLPNVYLPVFIAFFFLISIINILENILLPEEISLTKILVTTGALLFFPLFYFYFLSHIIQLHPTTDFRYLNKHLSLMMGYAATRVFIKSYVYFTEIV